jgi:hypothetical protein
MELYYLYHICLPKDKGNFNEGYIGVTNDFDWRMYQYKSFNKITAPKLRFHFESGIKLEKYIINTYLHKKLALKIERKLRPKPNMGWNKNPGGGGGISYHFVSEDEWKVRKSYRVLDLTDPNIRRTKLGQDRKRLKHEFYNKPLIQIKDSGEEVRWKDVFEASDTIGIPTSQINKVLRKQFKSCANSNWVFDTFTD